MNTTRFNLNEKLFLKRVSLIVLFLYIATFTRWLFIKQSNPNIFVWTADSPFSEAGVRFSDYFSVVSVSSFANPYTYNATNYPPTMICLAKIFNLVPGFLGLSIIILFSYYIILKSFDLSHNKIYKIIIVVTAFPLLFAVDRGNFDILIVAVLSLCLSGKISSKVVIALLYGLIVAAKFWPFFFSILILKMYGKRTTVLSISFCAILHLSSSIYFNISPTRIFALNASQVDWGFFPHNLSWKSFSSLFLSVLGFKSGNPVLIANNANLDIVFFILAILLLISAYITNHTFLIVLQLTILAIGYPSLSYYYKLSLILIALNFFMKNKLENEPFSLDSWVPAFIWSLMLGPNSLFYSSGGGISSDVVIVYASLVSLMIYSYIKIRNYKYLDLRFKR